MSEFARTEDGFRAAMSAATFHVDFHKKPIWLYVAKEKYVVSIIRPDAAMLAVDTNAVQFGEEMVAKDRIVGPRNTPVSES